MPYEELIMKIITWNVNGIRACGKKGLQSFIDSEKPDLLCLQETKAHLNQVEEGLQKLQFPQSYWSSAQRKGYSGVATFVRGSSVEFRDGWGIEAYTSEGRIAWTRHQNFDLYNIYFPNGGSGEERHLFKQKFLEDLNIHLKKELDRGQNIIVVGDYNVAHREIDVHDPVRLSHESGFLPEERQWMDRFLDLGFVDSFRKFHGQAKNRYSWWSYRELARISNRGWRIDYICVSKGLEKNLLSAEILDKVEGSDHCPVVAEFNF
jgi:exodeoxyribonuclease-3